jgi:hypothetical protein
LNRCPAANSSRPGSRLRRFGLILLLLSALAAPACRIADRSAVTAAAATSPAEALNGIAERYVKLVLALGEHDADYVDAYYGPTQWREAARAEKKPLEEIGREARPLVEELSGLDLSGEEEMVRLRREYLRRQLESLAARAEILRGRKMGFDEESEALYDAVAPTFPEEHFQEMLGKLERLLPGKAPLVERYAAFRKEFIVPPGKLEAVFDAAIQEARRRTRAHTELPPGESFTVEFVTGKSWGAYNWYKGSGRSVIQVNTDLPVYIDRAVDLAAHEGYPGHHVYNALLEERLLRERGWVEFSVYPLFSPQSLIAEGSANFGIEVAFPGDEQLAFERDTLYPLAGLDAGRAAAYRDVAKLVEQLDYAGNEAARGYLGGAMSADQAVLWLGRFALMPPDRARQRVRFMDQYRSYVINYNLGRDLVRGYIEKNGGTADRPEKRWEEFRKLLSSPRLPSGLR